MIKKKKKEPFAKLNNMTIIGFQLSHHNQPHRLKVKCHIHQSNGIGLLVPKVRCEKLNSSLLSAKR